MPNPFVPVMPSFAEVREALIKATRGAGFTFQTPPPPPPQTPEGHDIPEPLDTEEEGRPAFIPYRGGEFHGVEPPAHMVPDAEGYGPGTVDVVYDEQPPGHGAIDVRVISDDKEQLHAWRTNQLLAPAAGNPPQQIASRQRNRTKLKIKNVSTTDGVWIGPAAEVSAFNGYYLAPGDDETLNSTESVYALGNGPNLVAVCVLTEFVQEA
jgi:hypothetical protein